jgi:sulfoacetaldehyde dehydrogenase
MSIVRSRHDLRLLPEGPETDREAVAGLVARARSAMQALEGASQAELDEAVTAIAWSHCRDGAAEELARIAVRDTRLGNAPDKVAKIRRKTFGTLRDLLRVKSTGVIEELPERGLVKYAKPVGVVAALTPSTNPASTAVNKAMMAIKGGNAIIIAPSPLGWTTTARSVEMMRDELARIGRPADLAQVLPLPVSKAATETLMESCDLVVATGSTDNVRRAHRSGTPAIGVGVGNVPVIVDSSADVADAAAKIAASKTFDNATSCSSENALVVLDDVYERTLAALRAEGGYLADAEEKRAIERQLWRGGRLNRDLIARDAAVMARACGLAPGAQEARFFLVEESGVGPEHPFSGEKLSLVLTVYRARDFDHAIALTRAVLDHQGKGHSCGVHTQDMDRARRLAQAIDVVRVLVNQAHTFGNGGAFDNGLNFTLSQGCGTWGRNGISENLNYRHFLNITHLSMVTAMDRPSETDLFGDYWVRHGR